FIPLGELPDGVPVATNGGGYAESMAEHALAMALAAAKRLILEHENLKRDQFNQFTRNETGCSRGVSAESLGSAASEPQPRGWCTALACGCMPSTGMVGQISGWIGLERRTG